MPEHSTDGLRHTNSHIAYTLVHARYHDSLSAKVAPNPLFCKWLALFLASNPRTISLRADCRQPAGGIILPTLSHSFTFKLRLLDVQLGIARKRKFEPFIRPVPCLYLHERN